MTAGRRFWADYGRGKELTPRGHRDWPVKPTIRPETDFGLPATPFLHQGTHLFGNDDGPGANPNPQAASRGIAMSKRSRPQTMRSITRISRSPSDRPLPPVARGYSWPRERTIRRPASASAIRRSQHNPEFEGTKTGANKSSYTAVVVGSHGRILANNGVSAYRQTMGSRQECIR
jgi:hypothetical protein